MDTGEGIKSLGRLLKSARVDRDWTQKDVADRSGLTVGYISNVENGYINPKRGPVIPSDDALRSLAAALEMPLSKMHESLGRFGAAEVTHEIDPDLQMIVEAYEGSGGTGRRAIKSAAELALEISREGSIGKRAE